MPEIGTAIWKHVMDLNHDKNVNSKIADSRASRETQG